MLSVLAPLEPRWTLTGGGALVGFHLHHRTTRDLDLFWHGRESLGDLRREALSLLRAAGWEVTELRGMDGFSSYRVAADDQTVIVDLVAEPVPAIEPPRETAHRGTKILVDTPHEVLVNKLCALLHRSELRDLIDVEALVSNGGDLDRALADAPKKDGGFSAVTLGWLLENWDVLDVARHGGFGEQAEHLDRFRRELLERVTS